MSELRGVRRLTAMFLPEKWFKAQKAELKKILARPVGSDVRYWSNPFQDLRNYFDKFFVDFESMVEQPGVRDSIRNAVVEAVRSRVGGAKDYCEALGLKVDRLEGPYVDFKDPRQYLRWAARNSFEKKLQENVTEVGDLFKYEYSIDEGFLDKLVAKTMKKAGPEELASMSDAGRDEVKWAFLANIGYEKEALKALKRAKLDWDPLKWVDQVYQEIAANYTQGVIDQEGGYREFDLHGMKVIVDDKVVGAKDIQGYVKYLLQAHAALKAKGFGRAWYGNVFIRPEGSGGVNPNDGGGVGGWYETRKDTVTVFSRPSSFIVELMVHELGHRYWYKSLSSGQRGRFEDLVKVHTVRRPSNVTVPSYVKSSPYRTKLDALQAKGDVLIGKIKANEVEGLRTTLGTRRELQDIGWEITDLNQTVDLSSSVLQQFSSDWDGVREAKKAYLEHVSGLMGISGDQVLKWAEGATQSLEMLTVSMLLYLDSAVAEHNAQVKKQLEDNPEVKEWQDSYEKNPAPVLPVSNYGKSNISEAFAEVFAYYVLERELDRDQVESFRSVVSSEVAERIALQFRLASEGRLKVPAPKRRG